MVVSDSSLSAIDYVAILDPDANEHGGVQIRGSTVRT